MKKSYQIISMFLAVILAIGSLTGLMTVGVSADSTTAALTTESVIDYQQYYTKYHFSTPEEKLQIMTPYIETDDYLFYVNDTTGETALKQKATGEIIFSNPYDITDSTGSSDTKAQIMSQVVVQYTENGSDKAQYMYSFEEATLRNQVLVKPIKNGVRVEYVIGQESTRKLVPRMISKTRFEEKIQSLVKTGFGDSRDGLFNYNKFMAYYEFISLSEEDLPLAVKYSLIDSYEILQKDESFEFYVFAPDAADTEANWVESQIKTYCPNYTFEDMEADHAQCLYHEEATESPVFKMALVYRMDEDGLTVTLPANGLRYNSSKYTLESITILPYMCAGSCAKTGYEFFPDGSGALVDFDTPDTKTNTTIRGKVYGIDYAYHTISGKYQQPITCAVFGIVEHQQYYTYSYDETIITNEDYIVNSYEDYTVSRSVMTLDEINERFATDATLELTSDIKVTDRTVGFLAMVEEGESLSEIEAYRAGNLSDYNCVRTYFNPRPKDTYELSDSLSATASNSWTVVSDRKYTGNFTIRYMMLTDPALAAKAGITSYYDPSYVGMAQAYRDYLVKNNVLSRLTGNDVDADNIPLYIESFGTIEATEQYLSIPVTVHKALTTFENVKQMYNDLADAGIDTVNFRLTGFANGGLWYTVPGNLKWESAVGGKKGFENLIDYAAEVEQSGKGTLGIYPDFDFAYINRRSATASTGGASMKQHAVRTIDNRYSAKRYYSATKQKFVSYFQYALSPAYYSYFYEKLVGNYDNYNINTISVASIGYTLNSDFDKDDPYNREDSKVYTEEAFRYLADEKNYSVMTDAANSYVWKYADHILNVALDSSRYVKASASVPFLGIVLHGYVKFSGSAMNMEGDMHYAMLKAIENGAAPYFTLSYQNTDLLKEDEYYSKYYSVRYDIWKDDLIDTYTELNAALADVQIKEIVNHEILTGIRVLDADEIRAKIDAELAAAKEAEQNAERDKQFAAAKAIAETLEFTRGSVDTVSALYTSVRNNMTAISTNYNTLLERITDVETKYSDYQKRLNSSKATAQQIATAKNAYDSAMQRMRRTASQIITLYYTLLNNNNRIEKLLEKDQQMIDHATSLSEVLPELKAEMDGYVSEVEGYIGKISTAEGYTSDVFTGTGYTDYVLSAYNLVLEKVGVLVTEQVIPEDTVSKILEAIKIPTDTDEDDSESETANDSIDQSLISDNGNIVVVTYGERNGNDITTYKTFILNYNIYAVKVEYNGITYSIPSEDYVMIVME